MPIDEALERARLIKADKVKMEACYKSLADWVSSKYDIKVLDAFGSCTEEVQGLPNYGDIYFIVNTKKEAREPFKYRPGLKKQPGLDVDNEIKEAANKIQDDGLQKILSARLLSINVLDFDEWERQNIFGSYISRKLHEYCKKGKVECRFLNIDRYAFLCLYHTDPILRKYTKNGVNDLIEAKINHMVKKRDEFDVVNYDYGLVVFDSEQNYGMYDPREYFECHRWIKNH